MFRVGRWLILFLVATAGWADERIVLDQMSAVSCRVENTERADVGRCNVYYQNLKIHRGREVSETIANGDCVSCQSMVAHALKSKLKLIVDRNRDWDHPDFITFTSEVGFAPPVLRRLNDLEARVHRLEGWCGSY